MASQLQWIHHELGHARRSAYYQWIQTVVYDILLLDITCAVCVYDYVLCRAHRWVIPAESEVTVKLAFSSDDCGQFDQTLNFEIVGTRRRYQLHCRGVCVFPTVSREPRWTQTHKHTTLLFFTLSFVILCFIHSFTCHSFTWVDLNIHNLSSFASFSHSLVTRSLE